MKKSIIIIYIVLTILKWFTATTYFQREDDPVLIFKYMPTIENTFGGSDKCIQEQEQIHSWLQKRHYIDILSFAKAEVLNSIYLVTVKLWYPVTLIFCLYLIWKFMIYKY